MVVIDAVVECPKKILYYFWIDDVDTYSVSFCNKALSIFFSWYFFAISDLIIVDFEIVQTSTNILENSKEI